jgi:hypothetical protein
VPWRHAPDALRRDAVPPILVTHTDNDGTVRRNRLLKKRAILVIYSIRALYPIDKRLIERNYTHAGKRTKGKKQERQYNNSLHAQFIYFPFPKVRV